ncbi:MAG: hypothetical protein ACRDIZ_05170 [Actinomycetota bacterium]
MKLTRHARNRLRWIARRHRGVTPEAVTEALPGADTIGYDDRGNRKVRAVIGGTRVTVVVDEAADVVVTIWVE